MYDGEFHDMDYRFNGKLVFRKKYGTGELIEKKIVNILKKNPHPNIVQIYTITPEYFDMEMLKSVTYLNENDKTQLKTAKKFMQSLGIYYIDWKLDNLGRDENGVIKIFDFNFSIIQIGETLYRSIFYSRAEIFARWLFCYTYSEIDDVCFKTITSRFYQFLRIMLG